MEDKFVFIVGLIGLALGMWIMWFAITTVDEFTTPFGGHFVRVDAELDEVVELERCLIIRDSLDCNVDDCVIVQEQFWGFC